MSVNTTAAAASSSTPCRVAVAGASGRMGRMLIEAIRASDDCVLAGALDVPSSPGIGSDACAFLGYASGVAITADLKALGIRSVLNLRNHHTDASAFTKAGFTLLAEPMDAGKVTEALLVAALRKFRDAPKPVLVHCWHGSDRTGVFVAAYRVVFEGWTREAALDEFRNGGYGFHKKWFPNLEELLATLDAESLRKQIAADRQ